MATLGGVSVPRNLGQSHFQLIGKYGSGKVSAIRELVQTVLAEGDRVVLFGSVDDFYAPLYNPARGDLMLNPIYRESRSWDLCGELSDPHHLELPPITQAMVPALSASDAREFSVGSAQVFLEVLVRNMKRRGGNIADIWRVLSSASLPELGSWVADGQPDVASSHDLLQDMRLLLLRQPAVAALSDVANSNAPPLSMRSWAQSGKGVLFVPYESTESRHALMQVWLLLAIDAITSAGKKGKRTWIVASEMEVLGGVGAPGAFAGSLQYLSQSDAGTCVLGYRNISEFALPYGERAVSPIIESCRHKVIFKCSHETAKLASELVGPNSAAILPSQFSQLRDSEGYVKFAGSNDCWKVRFAG